MGITAIFKRPFAEQVAFFRGKLGNLIPTESWLDVQKSAHDTGFSIELTHTDFKDDRLYEWLREVVYVKMVPAPNDLPS